MTGRVGGCRGGQGADWGAVEMVEWWWEGTTGSQIKIIIKLHIKELPKMLLT